MPDEHNGDPRDEDIMDGTDAMPEESATRATPARRPVRRPRPSPAYTVGSRARSRESQGLSPVIVPTFAAVALLALIVAVVVDHFHGTGNASSVPATATVAPIPTAAPTNTPIPMPPPPTTKSGVAAEVNGVSIPMSLYADFVHADAISMQQGGTDPNTGSPIAPVDLSKPAGVKQFHQKERTDLDNLIQTYAAVAYAQKHHLVATQKQVQDTLNSYYANGGGKTTFLQHVKTLGFTEADVNTIASTSATEQNVLSVIGKQAPPDGRIVRHILVAAKDKALAEKLAKELQADHGSNFAALAKKYSTDTQSAAQGGSLGVVTHGEMVPPFDKAVFSLKYGQISDPVKSQYGWHIIEALGPGTSQTAQSNYITKWLKDQSAHATIYVKIPNP